jgi:cytochrome P450
MTTQSQTVAPVGFWRLRLQLLSYKFQCGMMNHPSPLRHFFALLRRFWPTAILGKHVLVTKGEDVRDVLRRLADFGNAEVLSSKMPWGPFVANLDVPEQHDNERALLETVMRADTDVAVIRRNAAAICESRIDAARRAGTEIDVVSGICEPVVVDMVQRYFGLPVLGEPNVVARRLSQIAGMVMIDPPAGSAQWREAHAAMDELTAAISRQIEQVPKPAQADDLITRLVVRLRAGQDNPAWFDGAWIRRHITGLIVFGGGTCVRAATQALDRLMEYPDGLRQARELALQLQRADALTPEAADEARARLLQIIYEALRFRPMLPLLVRHIPRDALIAKDAAHARTVPSGCQLLAPPIAAMHDPKDFPNPGQFDAQRCPRHYVHFGFGPRLCVGKYIADTLFVEMIRSVLLLGDLKRASGSRGRVKYDGPAVKSLVLTFKS